TRVLAGRALPVMVVEGGWISETAGNIVSTPDKQARYVMRHADLLDSVHAAGLIQLGFADVDLSTLPPNLVSVIAPFATLGLTDSSFNPKPALAAWDALFYRPLAP